MLDQQRVEGTKEQDLACKTMRTSNDDLLIKIITWLDKKLVKHINKNLYKIYQKNFCTFETVHIYNNLDIFCEKKYFRRLKSQCKFKTKWCVF